jgi:hypothetical protein
MDDQVDHFLEYLTSLSAREALTKAGVPSENSWLRAALS